MSTFVTLLQFHFWCDQSFIRLGMMMLHRLLLQLQSRFEKNKQNMA